MLIILRLFGIWSKLERWKSLISGCLMSCTKIKKKILFEYHLLLFYTTTMNYFSIGLWCTTESGLHTETSDRQLSGWTKKQLQGTFQSQTCTKQKKASVTFWWSAAHLTHSSFLNPSKTITLKSMLSKLMRCTKTSTPATGIGQQTQFFSTTTPNCTSHNQHFKSWINWGMKFCLICHIHLTSQQPIIMSSSILTTFSRENPSPSSSRQKMLSKGLSNPRTCTFVLQE